MGVTPPPPSPTLGFQKKLRDEANLPATRESKPQGFRVSGLDEPQERPPCLARLSRTRWTMRLATSRLLMEPVIRTRRRSSLGQGDHRLPVATSTKSCRDVVCLPHAALTTYLPDKVSWDSQLLASQNVLTNCNRAAALPGMPFPLSSWPRSA